MSMVETQDAPNKALSMTRKVGDGVPMTRAEFKKAIRNRITEEGNDAEKKTRQTQKE